MSSKALEVLNNQNVSLEAINIIKQLQRTEDSAVVEHTESYGFPKEGGLRNNEMCFYHVNKLSYDEDYPHREAFENVLMSLDNPAFNFVYMLTGSKTGIDLDLGVVENHNENLPVLGKKLSAINYGEIVASVFEGNFNGSRLKKLTGNKLREVVIDATDNYKNAGMIMGVPSINDAADKKYDFQGIDRLINSMLGLEWRVIIVCEPVAKEEVERIREDIFELYNRLAVSSKASVQRSANVGNTKTEGSSSSDAKGTNWSNTDTVGKSHTSSSKRSSSSTSSSHAETKGGSLSHTDSKNSSIAVNEGFSQSLTLEIANKKMQELMKYIDDELLKRLQLGFSKGMFKTSLYYMAKEPTHANRLKVGLMSLFQGNKSTYSPLCARKINLASDNMLLRNYQGVYENSGDFEGDIMRLLSRPFYNEKVGLATYLTTSELSLVAGLPQKEVPGLATAEEVNFGLNEKCLEDEPKIELGYLVQKGRELKNIPFNLTKKSLKKHTFIAGVTGSGKTTTCHRLLAEAGVPFLVIEPAKTEYRTLLRSDAYRKNLTVFTLGNESVAPFRINPFELVPGEVISSHIDLLKATFTSAFPMEASMPQLLEEAIYGCYEEKGWNIDTNENDKYGEAAFDGKTNSFPILSELLEKMKKVVEAKGFSERLQGDYIGSLVSRLSNLTVGSKGRMLNCSHSTDFNYLANNNIILEMEDLKSPEDKALVMGLVLSRLAAVVKQLHKKDKSYQHLTLIEEAHRLLAKVEYGDSGAKKVAVETFTDLLAEIRKYGEGLIIVDQIPNKLAPEVLKNTNTKLIHKILAKDDKETVGDTMLMDDKQKAYLSSLGVGEIIAFAENTDKPVHVHVVPISDTDDEDLEDEVVRKYFLKQLKDFGNAYVGYYRDTVLEKFKKACFILSKIEVDDKLFSSLRSKVKAVAEKEGCGEAEIWSYLVERWDRTTGKSVGSSADAEKRNKALVDFFTSAFTRTDFNVEDITQDIIVYTSI